MATFAPIKHAFVPKVQYNLFKKNSIQPGKNLEAPTNNLDKDYEES